MLETLIALDESVFPFLHQWATFLPEVWKALAIFGVYVIPIFLLWYWFTRRRETAMTAAIVGLFAWLGVNNIIAHYIGRQRPIPFIDLNFPDKEFIFDRPGPSFPSDHAAFLTTVTLIFWLAGERKLALGLGALTVLTSLARIVTAQHWTGDILVGILVGLMTVALFWSIRRPFERTIIAPLVKLARRLGF